MSVLLGSARLNEKGTINGGAAGDQTGMEVSTQDWYLHTKGWVVIRARDAAVREKIAHNMESICANDNIGYCQDHRSSLTTAAQPYGYDASKVTQKVEVDCSEAVRNCVLYAGIPVGSFSTAGEKAALKATGEFDILEEDKYCASSDYLLRGDILCTKTQGHTVVVLNDGAKVSPAPASDPIEKIDYAVYKDSSLSGTYTVTTDLYLRAGAGTGKAILTTMLGGSKVQCYGYYNTVSDGTKWLYVVYKDAKTGTVYTGYASSKYLKK